MDDSQRNLIVNYLPNSLTPVAFKAMFAPFGEIESCRIIYDKATGQSQGYGFVKFTSDEAASKAILTMNGHMVENKSIKVSLAQKTNPAIGGGGMPSVVPPSNSNGQVNLYVAHLPKHYTKTELEQMFQPYGTLLDVKVMLDPETGVSKGVGFVRFASKEEAQVAIISLHNQIPLGADGPVTVRFAEERKNKAGAATSSRGQYRYNPMGAAPAYGDLGAGSQYLMYQQAAAAQAAAGAANFGMWYQPAAAPAIPAMSPAVPAAAPASGSPSVAYCLFVYNLPQDADEGLLYRLFGPFGAISEVKIMRDATTNTCKGFGFVHYLKLEEAQQAIMSMNGYQLGNKFLQVSFKKQK